MGMTIALWCVLAAGLLPVLVVFIAKSDPGLDIHNPRDVHRGQTGMRKRAYGAHLNGNEAFPLFAAGVIIAMLRGVPQPTLDLWAALWLGVRIAYTIAYLTDVAKVRAGLWLMSVAIAAAIYVLPAGR